MSNVMNKVSIAAMVAYAKANEGTEANETEQDDDYILSVKEAYKSETGKDLAISNEVLAQILSQHKTFDEMETDAQIVFLTNAAQEVAKVTISDPSISILVGKIDKPAEEEFLACVDAIIKGVTSSMDTLAQMRRIYSKEELDEMPFPGLKADKMADGDNRRPDIVTTTLKNGDEITSTWTNDFVSSWPVAAQWERDIDDAKKERKSTGSVARYKNLSKKELSAILNLATKKRNAFRSMFKRALTAHHQISAIEMMPKVELMFIELNPKDTVNKFTPMPKVFGKGKLSAKDTVRVTTSTKPFWMYPKASPSDGKEFSVTQINNMDVRAAIAAGGEMSDLVDTIAKGADEGEGSNDTIDGSNADIGQAYTFVSQAANYFRLKANVSTVRKILADKKHPERKDWLELIDTLYEGIAPTYRQYKDEIEALDERTPAKTGTDS